MSKTSRNIVQGFRTLRRFCREVSLLLSEADKLMQNAGWKQASGSTALADMSRKLGEPNRWLPCYFCRFYTHPDLPHLISFISVLVEEIDEPDAIKETLITGGWIDYGIDNKRGDWEYWFSLWHLWMSDRRDDGRLHKQDPWEAWGREKPPKGVQQAVTFGYALEEIDSTEALKDRVVDRLIAAVGDSQKV